MSMMSLKRKLYEKQNSLSKITADGAELTTKEASELAFVGKEIFNCRIYEMIRQVIIMAFVAYLCTAFKSWWP